VVLWVVLTAGGDSGAAALEAAAPRLTGSPAIDLAMAKLDATIGALRAGWTEVARPDDPAWVGRRLRYLATLDQAVRTFRPDGVSAADAVWREGRALRMAEVDAASERELGALLDRWGWIDVQRFGARASGDAWLLAQHADLALQERVLALMEPLQATGGVRAKDHAYLYDRVALRRGGLQRWGTQGACADGVFAPAPLEDPAGVDARRAEVGLPPLRDQAIGFDCDGAQADAKALYAQRRWPECEAAWLALAERWTGALSAGGAWYNAACCAALDGRERVALDELHAALSAGWIDRTQMQLDPDLAGVRSRRGWAALIASMEPAAADP
jgi:hypothetical protein